MKVKVSKKELCEAFCNAATRLLTESKTNKDFGFEKATKRANRDIERDSKGNGFKSYDKVHHSQKDYSRKGKNRFSIDNYEDDLDYSDDMGIMGESAIDLSTPDDDNYYDDGYDTSEIPDINDIDGNVEYTDSFDEEPMVTFLTDIDPQERDLINNILSDNDSVEPDVVSGEVAFNVPKSMAKNFKSYLKSLEVGYHFAK